MHSSWKMTRCSRSYFNLSAEVALTAIGETCEKATSRRAKLNEYVFHISGDRGRPVALHHRNIEICRGASHVQRGTSICQIYARLPHMRQLTNPTVRSFWLTLLPSRTVLQELIEPSEGQLGHHGTSTRVLKPSKPHESPKPPVRGASAQW